MAKRKPTPPIVYPSHWKGDPYVTNAVQTPLHAVYEVTDLKPAPMPKVDFEKLARDGRKYRDSMGGFHTPIVTLEVEGEPTPAVFKTVAEASRAMVQLLRAGRTVRMVMMGQVIG